MQVGLIGKGYWGKILQQKLERVCNVVFACDSKDDYKTKLDNVDWVFVATPNNTHYQIVKYCIESGKNVFCEKPLTPTYKQSQQLFKLAKKNNVKLYVSDVFNYRDEAVLLKKVTNKYDTINVTWNSKNKKSNNDLLYHDLYLLYTILKDVNKINWPTINNVTFNYDSKDNKHIIDGIDFTHTESSNDALMEMIVCVISDTVDYKYNKEISLFCNKVIDDISNNTNI
tara:strand:+ start:1432 stop:2112 length:681 start_codon:yes stop_codon:yes gene_type:complete